MPAMGAVRREELATARPAHPSEIMNRMAGVWVNVTGGEGHTTAIRQPMTTDPVYLYLEDSIPSRSTGYFNHNALYEINLRSRAEVIKGRARRWRQDATAWSTPARGRLPAGELSATGEGGEWAARFMGSANSSARTACGRTQPYAHRRLARRAHTIVERHRAVGSSVRYRSSETVLAFEYRSADGGVLGDTERDFIGTTTNLTPISFRKVQALRLSTAYVPGRRCSSRSAFARYSSMEMIPNWT
jgi:hypothetical protein